MTDEEYLGCDDIGLFLAETKRRADCGEPHAFDGESYSSAIVTDDDCPF